MPSSSPYLSACLLPLSVALICGSAPVVVACGASGQAWLHEESAASTALPDAQHSSREVEWESATPCSAMRAAKPRLSHVISLGESHAASAASSAPSPANPAPNVQVNVTNYVSVPAPYGARSYARGYGFGSAQPAPRNAVGRDAAERTTPKLGGAWPAPPSYGPVFPFKSSPAPVWGSAQ